MGKLLKAMLTTGGATVVAQFLSLIVNKVLAHFIGTAGVGFYSLCRQVHDSAAGLGAVGAGGLLQGLAAREGDARRRLLRAGVTLSALGGAIVGIVLLAAPQLVAGWLFGRSDPTALLAVQLCALTAAIGIAYSLLSGIVNAARAINLLALIGIAGAVAAAAIAWPVAQWAVDSPWLLVALIGLPLLVQIAIALAALPRLGWRLGDLSGRTTRPGAAEFRYFAGFFAFNIALTGIATGAMLYVRARIVQSGGMAAAGLFAAGWGVGMQSMSLILSSFGTYVLPTVAATAGEERRKVLQDSAALLLGISLPLLTALLLFKPLVLRILFTAEFLPAVALLQWLLLGNYIKALSWVAAVPMLATADLRRYFVVEVGWYVLFAGGSALAMQAVDWLPAIGAAFVGTYVIYLLAALWLADRRYGFRLAPRSVAVLLGGAAVLVLAAGLTWNDTTVRWTLAISLPIVAATVALLALTPQQRQRGRLLALRMVRR
jgi:PST family polysaccharide transporter